MNDAFKDVPIKSCCTHMGDTLMLNDIRESITFNPKEPKGSKWRFSIMWRDGDLMPLVYCPACGKKIEEIEEETNNESI